MCILLVEDEFLISFFAEEVLNAAEYEVITAAHGAEAFDRLDSHSDRLTCLVTDYHMPGEYHGGHVIERTRATLPVLPIILASAHPHATTPQWRDDHDVKLLVKPYSPDELVELVDQLVG